MLIWCTETEDVETILALGEIDVVVGNAIWEGSKSNVGSFKADYPYADWCNKHVIEIKDVMETWPCAADIGTLNGALEKVKRYLNLEMRKEGTPIPPWKI